MKIFLPILTSLFTIVCHSQESLDSSIRIDNHQFRILVRYDEQSVKDLNSAVTIFRDGQKLLSDSLWSTKLQAKFKDINSDGYKDLFIYQATGYRPNDTYYLYLFQEKCNDFKRVVGFDDHPNIDTTDTKGILCATYLSGVIEFSFLQLTDSGKLINLNIIESNEEVPLDAYNKGLLKAKQKVGKRHVP